VFGNYEVGWRKPPVGHRFKKGQSGNPKGRTRGTRNLKTDLRELLQAEVVVREGERPVRISTQQALLKSTLLRALKGDARATTNILNLMVRVLGVEETAGDVLAPLSEDENALLAAFERRRARRGSGSGGGSGHEGGES
jgi:Family of unknown function (DUF5681)